MSVIDNGGSDGRFRIHIHLVKEGCHTDPHRTGMGSTLPSAERIKRVDGCGGIHAQARSRKGAKKFASSRRRQREKELLRDLETE